MCNTTIIDLEFLYEISPELRKSSVEIYIDNTNEKEANKILNFLQKENAKKKFRRILFEILNGRYNDELYKKIKGYDSVTEMRFKGRVFSNSRIYCKEVKQNGKKVVMISILKKSQNRIGGDQKTQSAVEKISKLRINISEK